MRAASLREDDGGNMSQSLNSEDLFQLTRLQSETLVSDDTKHLNI